jgi:hypothetical protein
LHPSLTSFTPPANPQPDVAAFTNLTASSSSTSPALASTNANINRFTCGYVGCNMTFARRGDFCRHAKKHLPGEHPCPVANCDRKGDEAFYRRDKLYDHLRKKHKMMI